MPGTSAALQQRIIESPEPDLASKYIVFFDSECGLCNRSVHFVHKRDRSGRIYFASLQGEVAQSLLASRGFVLENPESLIYYRAGSCYQKSSAALQIASDMGGFWKAARLLFCVPTAIRDWVYLQIARRRKNFCIV